MFKAWHGLELRIFSDRTEVQQFCCILTEAIKNG